MPDVIIIAGPNGAGKSTLAPHLLRDTFGIFEYVNVDTIAEGLSAFAPENAAFDAGRVVLRRLHKLAADQKDFAFETTLASRSFAGWLTELQESGYTTSIIFLRLENVDVAIQRVDARVKAGGHLIPENTIRGRYERGIKNLFKLYLPFVNSWRVFDAPNISPREIARSNERKGETVFDSTLWKQLKR